MSIRDSNLYDRLRNPEYTGDNRCLPCTIVNVVIAVGVSALIGIAAPAVGIGFFVVALLAIYFRGFLVPGTPTLTKRYLPDRVLAVFDKDPREQRNTIDVSAESNASSSMDAATDGTESDGDDPTETQTFDTLERLEAQRQNAVDPEAFLFEVDAVEPCADVDDLCLTDSFASALETEMDALRSSGLELTPELMADLFGTSPGEISIKDRSYPAIKFRRRIRKWPSDAACLADIATHRTLSTRTDRWASVPLEQRLEMLEIMRSFHEVCPHCGGSIALSEGTVESCCRVYEVLALRCVDCGEPLLEFDPEDITGDEKEKGFRP